MHDVYRNILLFPDILYTCGFIFRALEGVVTCNYICNNIGEQRYFVSRCSGLYTLYRTCMGHHWVNSCPAIPHSPSAK